MTTKNLPHIQKVSDWRFVHNDDGSLFAQYNRSRRRCFLEESFVDVITEAGKVGFNVDADFLRRQVWLINAGYKLNRFLPDGSGQCFSPIRDNGIIFTFSKIDANSEEYVC